MTADIPEFVAGQWVVPTEYGGEPGYVERVGFGVVEIRLISQWGDMILPQRTGAGFRVLDLHGNEKEAKKQADRLWHLLWPR